MPSLQTVVANPAHSFAEGYGGFGQPVEDPGDSTFKPHIVSGAVRRSGDIPALNVIVLLWWRLTVETRVGGG